MRRRFIKNLRNVIERIKSHNFEDLAVLLPEVNFNKFKKVGNNYLFLKCPLHNDKKPSFAYGPKSQIFHCFGCKLGGDMIDFYKQMRKKSFYPSIIDLAKFFKIKLEWQNIKEDENLIDPDDRDDDINEDYPSDDFVSKVPDKDDDDIPF